MLKTNILQVLAGIILILSIALFALWKHDRKVTADRNRERSNVENLTKEGDRQLDLTRSEYKHINAVWKTKLDSVIKDKDIAIKSVKSATIIKTTYKDTGSVKIVYREAIKQPDSTFKVPFESKDSKCWGVKGFINTLDPKASLDITERTANNSMQLLVTRKRFLGFLWYKKKGESFQGFSDCGVIDITQINFAK